MKIYFLSSNVARILSITMSFLCIILASLSCIFIEQTGEALVICAVFVSSVSFLFTYLTYANSLIVNIKKGKIRNLLSKNDTIFIKDIKSINLSSSILEIVLYDDNQISYPIKSKYINQENLLKKLREDIDNYKIKNHGIKS